MDNWSRRSVLKVGVWAAITASLAGCLRSPKPSSTSEQAVGTGDVEYLPVPLDVVPFPKNITFTVKVPGKSPVVLSGHYWYNANSVRDKVRCPAIVELNPYRCRDGTMYTDSKMYPWFAYNNYLAFRIDLQGSGNSEGSLTDEYTDEELSYCVQVIEQIAALPICDGNVGMMGESWSAINSLMVAARPDCPSALKAIVVNCGSDDRYNDDVHYMGGAMMMDNIGWASSMFGWLPAPPDPVIVGDRWKGMWRNRIKGMSFWFDQWGGHQTRDRYWSDTSVRDHYGDVKVPVFIMSGWQDGYKNPVDHVLRGLGALGLPVAGMIGPYGHRYPFGGSPGPRVDWLRYVTTHWWDRWLKGAQPDPGTQWPEFTVWMGQSREPDPLPDYTDDGRWVAEDHEWMGRSKPETYFLGPTLSPTPPPAGVTDSNAVALSAVGAPLNIGTAMLETSSFGAAGNPDLPRDQSEDDKKSITFDSSPLSEDLECFGYPTVRLNLECDRPITALALRLTEISPTTGASHLVSCTFFNLVYRDGDQANPKPVPPGIFSGEIPLNIIGHVFKRDWKLRVAISPFSFPAMWQAPEIPNVTIHTGPVDGREPSALILPRRESRSQDAGLATLLPDRTTYVDPEQYVPTLDSIRPASQERKVERITVDGNAGTLVRKNFDSGRTVYGGALDNLLVDVNASENFQILDGKPLSDEGFTHYETTLERGDWKVKVVTDTRVWSEQSPSDGPVFRYVADVRGFIGDEVFETNRVEGTIPRRWV